MMRSQAEIDAEVAHIEYAKAILNESLTALKAERDLLREDEFAKDKLTKRLAEFFKTHGFYIVSLKKEKRSEEHYALAKQIWRSREVLVPFIKKLSANKNEPFEFDSSEITDTLRNDLRNLCHVLATNGCLTYTICKKSFEIIPTLSCAKKRFLHGLWAEEITLYLIDKTLKTFTAKRPLKHKLFWNVKLKQNCSAKDNDMELDLVAQVADRFYIFETKSGEVVSIDKWVDRTRRFDDKKNRFITCTADENLNPRIFDPFRIFALHTLEAQFTQMLEEDFMENPALTISSTVPTLPHEESVK